MIGELSWPHGSSVNDVVEPDQYLGSQFMPTFSSIDNITTRVKCLGCGCHLYKGDIGRTFRHIKMDPAHYKLGLTSDVFCFDPCLPIG